MGKLIVIEGLDGSGKSTQLDLLYKNLNAKSIDCRSVSFPNYNDPSSTLVKMYLNGNFGKKPSDVNAFAASSTATHLSRQIGVNIITTEEPLLQVDTPPLMPFIRLQSFLKASGKAFFPGFMILNTTKSVFQNQIRLFSLICRLRFLKSF